MNPLKWLLSAAIVCLLVGVGMAQAQTDEEYAEYEAVETDGGTTVTAIRGLVLGDLVYDMEFPSQTGRETYDALPRFPTTFDFETEREASDARDAVNYILNEEGFQEVGASASEGSRRFSVGFREKEVRIGRSRFNFKVVLTLDGCVVNELTCFDDSAIGAWGREKNVFYLFTSTTTWADFTVVGFNGFDLPELERPRGPRR